MKRRIFVHPGSVLQLHNRTEPGKPANLPQAQGATSEEVINRVKSIHNFMAQRVYTPLIGENCYEEWKSEFGEKGGELRGNRFTLQIPGQKEWQNNHHFVNVTAENPKEHMKLLEGSNFHSSSHPVFPILDVEIKAEKPDATVTAMNLVFPVGVSNEIDTEFVVLQQDKTGTMQWNDITNKCKKDHSAFDHTIVINIPIEKSSKIWVVRVKRSFRTLIGVMLALLFGRTLFRILVFSKIQGGNKVKIRVLGMCEALYQNPLGLKTEALIAKEQGFEIVEESDAKQLLRKGKLVLSFYLSGKCQKSAHISLSEAASLKVAKRVDFEYTLRESGCVPKVEIETNNKDEDVLWSIDLKNVIQEQIEASISSQPDISCQDRNKVSDRVLLQVSNKVAASWEKFGICLGLSSDAIAIIDRNNPADVVGKCMALLCKWRSQFSGSITELEMALCDPLMQRLDIANELSMSTIV